MENNEDKLMKKVLFVIPMAARILIFHGLAQRRQRQREANLAPDQLKPLV